jgi:undecaprenyl-diphosphatase
MQSVDAGITHWINGFAGQSGIVDRVGIFLARWAILVVVVSIALRWWLMQPRAEQRFTALSCGLASALALGFNQIVLLFVDRVRPYDLGVSRLIVEPSADPSFPSDHASVVFAVALTLLLRRDRYWFSYLLAAAVISLSRVYVGLHFVGDLGGGVATALIAVLLVRAFYKRDLAINGFLLKIL